MCDDIGHDIGHIPILRSDPINQLKWKTGDRSWISKRIPNTIICKMAAILFRPQCVNSLWSIVTSYGNKDLCQHWLR